MDNLRDRLTANAQSIAIGSVLKQTDEVNLRIPARQERHFPPSSPSQWESTILCDRFRQCLFSRGRVYLRRTRLGPTANLNTDAQYFGRLFKHILDCR